jgi:hypothetical protein
MTKTCSHPGCTCDNYREELMARPDMSPDGICVNCHHAVNLHPRRPGKFHFDNTSSFWYWLLLWINYSYLNIISYNICYVSLTYSYCFLFALRIDLSLFLSQGRTDERTTIRTILQFVYNWTVWFICFTPFITTLLNYYGYDIVSKSTEGWAYQLQYCVEGAILTEACVDPATRGLRWCTGGVRRWYRWIADIFQGGYNWIATSFKARDEETNE